MARVNVEEWAFGDVRIHRASKILKVEGALILGRMNYVWHDSQEMLRVSGTRDEILIWTRMDIGPEADRFFDALVAVGYLTKIESGKLSGQYEIRGNKTQIASRITNIERGKKGGRATQQKWKRIKNSLNNSDLSEGLEPSTRSATATHPALTSNPTQPNPIQPSSNQNKKREKLDRTVLPTLALLWNEHRGPRLSPVVACGASRRRAIGSVWRDHPDDLFWIDVIRRIAANTFLSGECPSEKHPTWKADFDWMLKNDNAHKVVEGSYDQTRNARTNKNRFNLETLADHEREFDQPLGAPR